MHPYFQFPDELIQMIEEVCLKESGHKTKDDFIKFISPEIAKLSDLFNQRSAARPFISTRSFPHYPLAYLSYFLPSNFFKMAYLLLDLLKIKETIPFDLWPDRGLEKKALRFLDLGAGPGTNGLGLLDFCARFPFSYFKNQRIEYTAVYQDARQLDFFTLLFSKYHEILKTSLLNHQIFFDYEVLHQKINLKPVEFPGKFDFILMGNLLNEMKQYGHSIDSLVEWTGRLMTQLTPKGFLIIFEPALRKTSRDLLRFRNLISAQGIASIVAPCLHQGPCPIMEPGGSEKDWCHQEKEWIAPEWIQQIDRKIGKRKDALKYSYLILSSPDHSPVSPSSLWRAVSEVLESKGKKEIFLCNQSGRLRFYRLNKEEGKTNLLFSNIVRGDLVAVNRPQPCLDRRVLPSWEVKIRP